MFCSMLLTFHSDWKKLTFYFYSTEYINFNLLVGDLFKIYKTRIWLSAINPAAFRSRPNQPPSSIGPGAIQPGSSPRTMNPAASSFFVSRNGGRPSYQEPLASAPLQLTYNDSTANHSHSQGQAGPRNGPGRPSYFGSPGFAAPPDAAWYMPVGSYGQQAFDAPYHGTPSPAHDLAFRPAPAFGQGMMRNGNRPARTGDFGPMQ
jgi:hypothetical protein